MRRLLISALLLCSAPVSAQHLAPEDYIFPLRDVAGLYSANFGEMRPNHFHSGIDIKTDGVTGKPVLATADGLSHASPSRRAAMDAPSTSPIPTARLPYMGTSRSSATTSKNTYTRSVTAPGETASISIPRPTGFRSSRANSSPGREIQARPQARTCISRSATPARSGPSTPFPAA